MYRWLASDRTFVGAYGIAHFGKGLFWQSSEVLFIFFLTELCGIPASQAGLALGGGLLFSALADLAIAKYLAVWLRSTAAAARMQLVGTVLCALALLLFSSTAAAPADARLAFAITASLAFRLAYALIDVPQNAMLGLATQDDTERTRLSSIRFILGGLAGLCVAGLVALLINGVREVPSQAMISLIVAGLGLVAISGAVFQLIVARYREPSMVQIDRLPADMVGSINTLPVLVLVFMGMVVALTAPVFSKLEPYFAAYVLQSATAGGLVVGATSLGGIVSQPIWVWLSDRVTRKSALQAGGGTMAVGALAFLGVASLGTLQAAACGFVFGAGLGGLGMAIWAALADSTARPTVTGKTPSAAAIFAAFSFASKAALAGSIFLVGWLLSIHPYRVGSSESVWPLLPVMCLLPAAGAGVCIGIARWLDSSPRQTQSGANFVDLVRLCGRPRGDRRAGLETPAPATSTRDKLH